MPAERQAGPGPAWIAGAKAGEMRCDRQRISLFSRQIRRSPYEADFIGRGRLAQERRQRLRHGVRFSASGSHRRRV